jgi:hypothetical protein
MALRDMMRRLKRAVEAEMTVLVCRVCGEKLRVARDTDLEYIAYCWSLDTGVRSHQPTSPDVFVIANHPHEDEALIDKATGEPWLEGLLGSQGGRRGN